MITEDVFKELWDVHKEKLLRISGCFPTAKRIRYSVNTIESQFEDFLVKFIKGYIKMGGTKVQQRIAAFNFSLPQVDSLTPADTGLPYEFLEGFRLALYMFLQYKNSQQCNSVFQMNRDKCNLPVFKEKNTIISSVENHSVTIIIGDTGCGKSTQIPQYLVSAGWSHIVCTQPRRLSTISLSERVSKEMFCEDTGDVGYQIRFESRGRGHKLKFVTEGILLKQIQSDPLLKQYSMVIVDEVHERHISTDMLLGVLKIIAKNRDDFRIVIMSATMDPQQFIQFFSSPLVEGAEEKPLSVNVLTIPGRTYPVTIHYYPPEVEGFGRRRGPREERENPIAVADSSLDPAPYLHILKEIDSSLDSNERGDVLIFVSGLQEINTLVNALSEFASSSGRWVLLRLHSTLLSSEQQLIFNPTQPGVRKCIISTNIAETSVTIPNVRYVIDSGKNKELTEPSLSGGTTVQLHECYISRSSARQRAGRAGRTGPGVCYRLYSEDDFYEMTEYSIPEIFRGNIDDSVLLIQLFHALGILPASAASITSFPLLDYPANGTIRNSMKRLLGFSAINRQYAITSLGCLLSHLPLPISHGYFLILAAIFQHPYYGALLCSSLSFQSLFLNRPPQSSYEVNNRRSFDSPSGDLISNLHILLQFVQTSRKYKSAGKWCSNRMLSYTNMMNCMNIVTQLISLLSSAHLINNKSSSLIEKESFEDRKRREIKREELLKQKRVEILDIKHNDELQRESDFNYSIDTSTIEVEQPLEDVDTNENDLLLNLSSSNKRINMKEFHSILSASISDYDESTLLSKDNELFFSFLVGSVFYPNLAVSNKSNGVRPSNEWTFLTQSKDVGIADVLIYPTSCVISYYSSNPDDKIEYPLKDKLIVYEKILDTKKPYLTNVTVLPFLPSLLLLAKEIDFDNDHHILFDRWLYVTVDHSISFTQICELLEVSQVLRMDLKRVIRSNINSLHNFSFLTPAQMDLMRKNMEDDEVMILSPSNESIPKAVNSLKSKLTTQSTLPSIETLQMRITEFLKTKVPCSVEDINVSKVKALFGLIPSCEELITEIKNQKNQNRNGNENAITKLEQGLENVTQEEENELVDYSSRLGVADSLTSLDTFKRKGIQLSPWLWYGSLQTTSLKATIENFPDLISDRLTVRWDCPVCKQTMYVTKEELVNHLNDCVK